MKSQNDIYITTKSATPSLSSILASCLISGFFLLNLGGCAKKSSAPAAAAADTTTTTTATTTGTTTDTTPPTVTNVTSSTANGSYKAADVISIQVTFSESVDVTGTPLLALSSGGSASYASGTGGATLTFTYTVGASQTSSDLDFSSTSALTLNGGTLKDAAANDATLTLMALGASGSLAANRAIVIDTTAPTVTNTTSSTANGSYKEAGVVSIQITFSEAVTVTGTPLLALDSGGSASYASGSPGSTLTFTYTVGAGQTSSLLEYSSTSSLTLNGGTLKDAVGNDATRTLIATMTAGPNGSLGGQKGIIIDTTTPSAPGTAVATPASPNASTTPMITGAAASADTASVGLFSNAGCTSQIGTGTRAEFLVGGITATVSSSATTTIYGKTTDTAGNASACTSLLSYTNVAAAGIAALYGTTSTTWTQRCITVDGTRSSKSVFTFTNAGTFTLDTTDYTDTACATPGSMDPPYITYLHLSGTYSSPGAAANPTSASKLILTTTSITATEANSTPIDISGMVSNGNFGLLYERLADELTITNWDSNLYSAGGTPTFPTGFKASNMYTNTTTPETWGGTTNDHIQGTYTAQCSGAPDGGGLYNAMVWVFTKKTAHFGTYSATNNGFTDAACTTGATPQGTAYSGYYILSDAVSSGYRNIDFLVTSSNGTNSYFGRIANIGLGYMTILRTQGATSAVRTAITYTESSSEVLTRTSAAPSAATTPTALTAKTWSDLTAGSGVWNGNCADNGGGGYDYNVYTFSSASTFKSETVTCSDSVCSVACSVTSTMNGTSFTPGAVQTSPNGATRAAVNITGPGDVSFLFDQADSTTLVASMSMGANNYPTTLHGSNEMLRSDGTAGATTLANIAGLWVSGCYCAGTTCTGGGEDGFYAKSFLSVTAVGMFIKGVVRYSNITCTNPVLKGVANTYSTISTAPIDYYEGTVAAGNYRNGGTSLFHATSTYGIRNFTFTSTNHNGADPADTTAMDYPCEVLTYEGRDTLSTSGGQTCPIATSTQIVNNPVYTRFRY